MKKPIILLLLLWSTISISQQHKDTPWMKTFEGRQQDPTFEEVQQAFNAYWETHDKDAKGSGYKPFKRWEQLWKRRVKADGSLPNGKDFYEAWEAKNRFQTSGNRMADLSNWLPIGPNNHVQANAQPSGQGRLNAVTIDPNNNNIWYVGSPNGGLWKTINAGSNWIPMTDQLPRVGVSAIAIDYNNSNIIYIATGDDDADQTPTIGVMKSIDGGSTWNTTGLNVNTIGNASRMGELFIDPANSNKLVCATDDGVYISNDAGTTWTQTLAGENIRDLRIKPGDASIVYCVSPSTFYRSTNGGTNFSQITSGVPTNTGRMVIDVTPADPNYVYIFSSDATDNRVHGIYRSTNSGQSFSTRQEDSYTLIGNGQVWYNFAMGVSDTNPEELYVGVMDVWRSTNGGQNWNKLNRWDQLTEAYTHADIHSIRVHEGNVFVASDGGIYSSQDNGTNFTPHYQDLQIGEFFNVAVAQGNSNNISGGLQDNGGFGVGFNGEWRAYHPGDGVNTLITPTDDDTYYGFIQNGGTLYVSNHGDGWFTRVFKPSNSGQGVWVAPLSADSNGDVYAAWSNLFKLNRTNYEWELVGSLGGYTDIMEIAPSDPNRIVSSGHQDLRVSSDGGQTLDFNTNVVGNAIAGIAIHKDNPDIMWITTDGDYENKGIFKTIDGGITWVDITGNFPVATEYPEDIVHQGDHPLNPLYVSTDLGIYRLDDGSPDWQPFMTNLPNTKIEDLEINLLDQTITAATYGRGLWRSSIPVQLAPNDVSLVAINNPDASQGASCGDVSPQIRVRSNGINLITEITVTYGVSGDTPQTYTWNGSLASNEEATIDLPSISVPAGSHVLEVETTIPNDATATNNQRTKNFNINASGEVNSINSFENTSDILLTENGVWERGVPSGSLLNTAATGTQAYATNLSGNYPTNTNASLLSNCYDFTLIESPVLKFQMAFDIEENWDWANVQYSLNGAQNWNNLGSINSQPNWYNSDRTEASFDCPGCPGAQWTGTNTTMTEYAYDFAANATLGETDLTTADNIIFRITLHSDSVINQEGMVIDDFTIEGIPIVSKISPVAYLQGAGVNPVTGEENLMRDDLRVAGIIPTTSPYTDGLTIDPSILSISGTDAIVDWVWVELRDGSNRATIIAGQSALLQRDGNIVSIDGTSPLSFSLTPGNYHIKLNHRNHLGIATSNPITIGTTTSTIDFTADSTIINGGTVAVTNLASGKLALYAGDGNTDGSILNTDILNALQQSGASGYLSSDVNMDTFILNNDIQLIIQPNAGKIEQE
ncbi:glycosyl hydrolase [Dokdonia sp.]|uniref:VPS10 domain-containing protein n=1 Tax=Dokdonia sp. TaxID=2024995 RepID=UPI003266B700